MLAVCSHQGCVSNCQGQPRLVAHQREPVQAAADPRGLHVLGAVQY